MFWIIFIVLYIWVTIIIIRKEYKKEKEYPYKWGEWYHITTISDGKNIETYINTIKVVDGIFIDDGVIKRWEE